MTARRRTFVIGLGRALNAAFFFLTSVYCLLNYSPFTYEQFIKPTVSAALAGFAVWHGAIGWLVLCVTALTLAPFLDRPRARDIGWSFLAASLALSAWFFTHPLWLQAGTSPGNLILAVVCALPPIWLAVFDHVAAGPVSPLRAMNQARSWTACWLTAVVAFAAYAVAAPLRLRLTGGIPLTFEGVVLGWIASCLGHVTLFTLVFLALTIVGGLAFRTRSPGHTEYWALVALGATGVALILFRVVLAPVAIRGLAAWSVSASMGVALAAAWSGVGRHRIANTHGPRSSSPFLSSLDAWLAPISVRSTAAPIRSATALVIAVAAVHLMIARLSTFDWEFMLQKLVTLGFWLVAFACVHAALVERAGRSPRFAPAVVIALFAAQQVLLPRLPAVVGNDRPNAEFALDGYAAVDPSFRIARDLLGPGASADAAEFYAYLRANSALQGESIEPVDIGFVQQWTGTSEPPPHIFLFIIDSLRRDYVSVYNKAVDFTPAIDAFAEDSLVFRRAFSRYAGTGLAVPSIWAGSMLIHKQYVTPFAPMNALEKLVSAKGYRRLITEDHLTDRLFSASSSTTALDARVPEMLHTFCRTMGELEPHLHGNVRRKDPRPLFALTRPLDLHIGNIASATVPPGESYPGFHAPYAARVRRIDACFGEFIDTLKRARLYDRSVIVLTSDHGDSLGEGQRWGHGFTAFPEVLRIPLIIHVPVALRDRVSADLGRVSFSTDVTPTLYALVGEPPVERAERGIRDLLTGSPLIVDRSVDLSWRRRESYLVASSYGPVYGLIEQNGRRLYVADGVESREYAYDLGPDGTDVRIGVTDAERERYRLRIREQVGELAAWYRFTPEP